MNHTYHSKVSTLHQNLIVLVLFGDFEYSLVDSHLILHVKLTSNLSL